MCNAAQNSSQFQAPMPPPVQRKSGGPIAGPTPIITAQAVYTPPCQPAAAGSIDPDLKWALTLIFGLAVLGMLGLMCFAVCAPGPFASFMQGAREGLQENLDSLRLR